LLRFGSTIIKTLMVVGLTLGAYRNDWRWVGTAEDMLFYYGLFYSRATCPSCSWKIVEQPVLSCSGSALESRETDGVGAGDGGVEE
jgi:hypothetical protein